jgi:hypothetical protein
MADLLIAREKGLEARTQRVCAKMGSCHDSVFSSFLQMNAREDRLAQFFDRSPARQHRMGTAGVVDVLHRDIDAEVVVHGGQDILR